MKRYGDNEKKSTIDPRVTIDQARPMKVTAFVGSARKKHTFDATEMFLKKLQHMGNIEYEIVQLSDYDLKPCIGCKTCMDRDEMSCPLKDDREVLIQKLKDSDGVVIASPNYLFHESALIKIFLERISFYSHRPYFFSKTFSSIVSQGMMGGRDIVKYLNFVGDRIGFNVVRGSCVKTLEPMTEKGKKKIEKTIEKHSRKFYSRLTRKDFPTPSLFKLMIFRMSRTSIRHILDGNFRDHNYFSSMGWFESDYYYPVSLSPFKRVMGNLFDLTASKMAGSR